MPTPWDPLPISLLRLPCLALPRIPASSLPCSSPLASLCSLPPPCCSLPDSPPYWCMEKVTHVPPQHYLQHKFQTSAIWPEGGQELFGEGSDDYSMFNAKGAERPSSPSRLPPGAPVLTSDPSGSLGKERAGCLPRCTPLSSLLLLCTVSSMGMGDQGASRPMFLRLHSQEVRVQKIHSALGYWSLLGAEQQEVG